MSKFKIGPVPVNIQRGLSVFLLEIKKRLDILGGDTNAQLITKQDLIDMGLIGSDGIRLGGDTDTQLAAINDLDSRMTILEVLEGLDE